MVDLDKTQPLRLPVPRHFQPSLISYNRGSLAISRQIGPRGACPRIVRLSTLFAKFTARLDYDNEEGDEDEDEA